MKALVVDDNEEIRLVLTRHLTLLGYDVDCAENGRDAVLKFVSAAEGGEAYRFVSMDYEMPVMNGHSAVQMISAYETTHFHPDNRSLVCFVSGSVSCSCPSRSDNTTACPTCFLGKPVDFTQFRKLATSVLSDSRSGLPACEAPCCLLGK